MIRFVMVWVGQKYGPEYPLHLGDMIARNSTQIEEMSLECITDRPGDLPEGIRAIKSHSGYPGWWAKIQLFSPDMPWDEGDQIIYLDLDVIITGRLEQLVGVEGIIRDWHWPCYNSSVMSWRHGQHREIWDLWTSDEIDAPPRSDIADLLPKGQVNGGDQVYITEVSRWDTFPSTWFPSYRKCAAGPPAGSVAVIMHGDPKPDVAGGWVDDFWKVGGLTSLPEMKGVNVSHDQILDNVRVNCARDLQWFTPWHPSPHSAVLVCGGPSMKDNIAEIRAHARRGAQVVSVNNALPFLIENRIYPGAHIMLDARPENAAFVKDAPPSVRYFLASQVHPDVFDALQGREVVVWHNAFGTNEELKGVLEPYWDTKPVLLIPGGGTVGLRALWLLHESGFRKIHVYGMDSSYEDGAHHAYAQPLNDGEQLLKVTMGGKDYTCARWMARQSEEFRETWADLQRRGTRIFMHGRGLIPDIAKALVAAERGEVGA